LNTPFNLVLILCLSGLGIRMIYEELKKAEKIDPQNKLTFALALLGMSLFLPSWFFLCPLDPWRVYLPAVVHWIGIAMAVAGALLALIALATLRGVENIDHLVTGGLFRYLRHPMYTGFILWILGWITASGAMMSLIAGVVSIACVLYWARLEEVKLTEAYGDGYREYQKRTRL
jgi:protein-S-isoprenylcysteine O-methyltransferase Ste14